ncbi:MAG: hypothetical protein ABSB66_08760 [Candidatus Acidiferrales bacterium]
MADEAPMPVVTVSTGCHRKAGGFFLVRPSSVSSSTGSNPASTATFSPKIFAILREVLRIAGILNNSTRPQKIKHFEEWSRTRPAIRP